MTGAVPTAGSAPLQDGSTAEEDAYLKSTIPRPVIFLFSHLAGRSYRRGIAPAWARAH